MDALRTPEDRFAFVPGYPWQPTYVSTSDGLRVAVLDEGPRDAPAVHTTIEGAAHFVQEDRGEQLATVLADWIKGLS